MTELNHQAEPFKVKYLGPYSFSIGDTSKLSPYTSGGVVTQVKMAKHLHFKSFRDSLQHPTLMDMDIAKWGGLSRLLRGLFSDDIAGSVLKYQRLDSIQSVTNSL